MIDVTSLEEQLLVALDVFEDDSETDPNVTLWAWHTLAVSGVVVAKFLDREGQRHLARRQRVSASHSATWQAVRSLSSGGSWKQPDSMSRSAFEWKLRSHSSAGTKPTVI